MILRKGDKSIGAYHFPDRKKPHICYSIGNQVYDCGHFNNEDAAERFMNALAEMTGVKVNEDVPCARAATVCEKDVMK